MTEQERGNALLELIDKIEILGQFQDRIDSPFDLGQIWEVFLADARNLIEIDVCALFLVDDESREFVLNSATPEDKGDMCEKEILHQIESGIFSWVIQRRQPALIPPLVFEKENSFVLLPLSTVKRTLGVVLVVAPIRQSQLTHETLKLLSMLGRQCSLIMENNLLYEGLKKKNQSLEQANREIRLLSRTDALTGCYNRGYIGDFLPREIKRALRYKHPLSLVMCDIDFFKKVNDTHGHQAGDEVLKGFTRAILEIIRTDMDWLARYGGEEFLVVLPETGLDSARIMAERLREHISTMVIEIVGARISITASFGVTGFHGAAPPRKISSEALIDTADKWLYQAKEQGRNRVIGGKPVIGNR